MLVFKTQVVVEKINLDQSSEPLKIDMSGLIRITLTIAAIIVLVLAIWDIFWVIGTYLNDALNERNTAHFMELFVKAIAPVLELTFGSLILLNRDQLTKWLEKM